MRVLIVEDDRRLGAVLRRGLDREGFGVDVVGDGAAALAAVLTTDFDVVVLDVMLPGSLDGFEVCAELRGRRVRTPILMLTALDAVEERVRGLDVGADDYLVKPFALSELLARLRALSRRHLDDRSAILRAGALELDTVRRRVSVAGLAVGLTMKEFSILELLLLHPGQLISRTQIEEHVWNYDFAGESNLVEVYIGRLRRKLAAVGMGNPIETVRHGGYRLEARAPSATPSGVPESA